MAKITRKQIKEDKLLSTTAKFYVYLNKYWKQIVGVVAVAIILVAAISVFYRYTVNRNERASLNLIEAMAFYSEAEMALGGDDEDGSATEKYEKAMTKFEGILKGGGRDQTISEALFYSAKCSYRLGKYSEAISTFEKVISKYPKNILAFYSQGGTGQCYEQIGDDESLRKAIQQYDKLSRYPENYVTLQAFIDKGRCYEKLGEWDQAIKEYSNIVGKFNAAVELAIQARCKELAQSAGETIAKYRAASSGQLSADFAKFESEAKKQEKNQQWFEALKMYDKAIFSQKEAWGQENASDEGNKAALDALRAYENSSANVIRYVGIGRRYEKQENRDEALRNFRRAVLFNFLPDKELYDEAQLRIDWINTVEKNRMASGSQKSE